MPPAPPADPVDAFVAAQAPAVRPLLDLCRTFLHSAAPGLREGIKWRVPTFMMEHNLFYLNPQADHVVLGFCNGAKMPEFRSVFDRVQAEVAHVLVRSVDDLRRPGLRAAVRHAAGLPTDEPVRLRDGPQAVRAAMRSLPT